MGGCNQGDPRCDADPVTNGDIPPVGKLPYLVTLPGHGYMAFRLATDAKPPGWHEERLATRRLPVLVLALVVGLVAFVMIRTIIDWRRARERERSLGPIVDGPDDSPFGRLATLADPTGAMFKIVADTGQGTQAAADA